MRLITTIILAIALLVIALVMFAPATVADVEINRLSGGSVRLAQAKGTVWNGEGELILAAADARIPLAWQIDPAPLLRGVLSGSVGMARDGDKRGSFLIGGESLSLRNIAVALPAATVLRAAGVPGVFAAVGGMLDLRIESLSKQGQSIEAKMSATWDDATLPGPSPEKRISLGNVRADVAGQGTEVPGTIGNLGGDVELAGTLGMFATGARVNVVIKPRAGIDAQRASAINSALMVVGRPDGLGGYRVPWSTSIQ